MIRTTPMNRFSIATPLLAALALLTLASRPAQAQANDMFPTKAAAEQRAKQLKCTGAFAMGDAWMPCKNFEAYEQASKRP